MGLFPNGSEDFFLFRFYILIYIYFFKSEKVFVFFREVKINFYNEILNSGDAVNPDTNEELAKKDFSVQIFIL